MQNNDINTISEGLRQYIEALVEEVVLEGKPFENQKKYLCRFCQAEGIDYASLEKKLINFFISLEDRTLLKSKNNLYIVKVLANDCYLSENEINKLIAEKNKLTTPDDQLFPIRKNEMWGYMTVTGDIAFMVDFAVDRVSDFHEGLASFLVGTDNGKRKGKQGFIDRNGKIIFTPQYDEAHGFSNERSIVQLFNGYGVIDKNGNWVIEPRYRYVHRPFPDIFTCSSGYLYDKDGQSIKSDIRIDYFAYDASGGLLAFKGNDGNWGFIDSNGEIVIKPQYYEIDRSYLYFNEGLCAVGSKRHLWGYIDHIGRMAIKRKYQEASYFRNGLAVVKLDRGRYGIIDRTGDLIFSADHRIDESNSFKQIDFGIIEDGSKHILFNKAGNILKSFSSDSRIGFPKYGFVDVENNEKYGILNSKGEQVISCKYDCINILSNSLVAVKNDGKWGLIDMSDRIIVKPMYDSICNYRDGLLSVVKDGKMGYINTIGELIYLE